MSIQNIKEVQRESLVVHVAALLRDSIAKGDLPPGTHLVEQDVSQQLGVSRGPLREALRVLETEGLVRSYPGRGSYVSELSENDIWEIYSLRTILEEEAIRLATKHAKSDDLSTLQEILNAMFQAAKEGDHALVLDLDLRFHQQIWKMAGHSRLEGFLKEVAVQARMYIAVQTSLYDDLTAGVSDHETILEHLKSGNEEAAAGAMRSHLQVSEASLRAFFKQKQSREDLLNRDVE